MFLQSGQKIQGFTLIELSIVLVVIGLIVGGILVGQSLISAAEVRAQITQIEKYNAAVNTFRSKFNAIPGDMRPELAQQYGFYVGTNCNGAASGRRDGNGLIDGGQIPFNIAQGQCEAALFWQDLSSPAAGGLIAGQYPNNNAQAIACGPAIAMVSTTASNYFPSAEIGHSNSLYVYELNGYNWYGLSSITSVNTSGGMLSSANISVMQAYNIDIKTDDGAPITGNIIAQFSSSGIISAPNTTNSGGNSTSCYDTTTGTYSITVNNGSGANCALSFKFN